MTRSLVITAPAAQRDAVNTALEAGGYGPGNLSVPMKDGERLIPDEETGDLPETPTHYSSHWWTTEAEYEHLQSLRNTVLSAATFNAQQSLDNVPGIFSATNGDYVRLTHKQFDNGQWGWRAEFVAQAQEFEPGVRAIAIYADAEHQQYLYTTGAFTDDNGTWATEWNDGTTEPEAVHWALIYASQPEHAGTLEADESEDIGWLRIGVPGDAVPPEGGDWTDSGATTNGPSGAGTMGVSDDAPFEAGQTIRVDQDDNLITQVTGIHSANLLLIDPHITVGSGQMIEIQS